MLDIAFLTTSVTKVAHAKQLCKDHNVNIIPYRHLFYGISYIEPRVFDRNELLKRSIEDAKIRWKKNLKDTSQNKLFIIEDTSVVINALSTFDKEVPGVDIKYWMKENSFEQVDNLLKNLGNDRRVKVISHLILYLTSALQRKTEVEYIIFSSSTDGYLTNEEFLIKTQPLYPWLDSKTFNKWFVPIGYDLPISLLPIEEANKVDFRKGAFNSMLKFLAENDAIPKNVEEPAIWRIGLDPFLIMCGPTCAGKTTGARYLSQTFNYYHIEASDFMYLNYYETHGTNSSIKISEYAKEALLNDSNIVVDRILEFLNRIGNRPIVITGFRSPNEVTSIKSKLALDNNYTLLYLEADQTIRFDRWVKRDRDNQPLTLSEFSENNRVQNEMGLSEIRNLDCQILQNNYDGLVGYYEDLANILSLTSDLKTDDFIHFEKVKIDSLEGSIILALLAECFNGNEFEYFTTTQISHLILKHLGTSKFKDNISRYFNQKFYPFYELLGESDKLRIRLSPTGMSQGILLLSLSGSVDNPLLASI